MTAPDTNWAEAQESRLDDHEQQMQTVLERLDRIDARLGRGDDRMTGIESAIASNTATTEASLSLLNDAAGGFRFLTRVAKVFAPLASAAMAGYALIYMLTHGGAKPPGH